MEVDQEVLVGDLELDRSQDGGESSGDTTEEEKWFLLFYGLLARVQNKMATTFVFIIASVAR